MWTNVISLLLRPRRPCPSFLQKARSLPIFFSQRLRCQNRLRASHGWQISTLSRAIPLSNEIKQPGHFAVTKQDCLRQCRSVSTRTKQPVSGRPEANAGVALSKAASDDPVPKRPGKDTVEMHFTADGVTCLGPSCVYFYRPEDTTYRPHCIARTAFAVQVSPLLS
ncbi:hypothetical protein K445DRAFT_214936 [Daldinia sp. EC12]|nr:hypothetical protein K445DRAFT_214936 [Daldinia sp. EC12]